ncbi:transcriptional regulator, TetR family [Methanolacinia petrolearia DSM 11571]|uniref:Transcriptional regulator, TetR family n=1 Tax=Methanolacinia petrolearia (strain DSM 11571 / OCM 486 / SEBR 4847) TaxID=679926 RepID=E1RDJ4_METP4|nr:TetR/AcrR family transcriptional regulator [Methanolacinia petrolearia]ADN35947.1 transcriptional regulator, TetR family [Methanolacinia petrolearia DSM 11571]
MGIADRRQREKEQRKNEIIEAAERLFFSRSYEDVSMEDIAREVELNKATIYLYFKNKEALFAAVVLRGVRLLEEKYKECMVKDVPGIVRVLLMGQAYYLYSQEYPDYLRMIHYYGSERFSGENPCTAEIGKGYGTCRLILRDAIREGIDDGTIRADLDPFLASMYLMTSFMGILSMENKWKLVIEAEGFSYEQFTGEFFRFIIPSISSGKISPNMDTGDFESFGFSLTDIVESGKGMK